MSLNDEPTVADLLDHDPLAGRVARRIADECRPPYVLGIHGDWGSGKTSFLRKLQAQLEAEPYPFRTHTRIVFFEAWRHQFEAEPAVALLHTIREHFSLLQQLRDRAGKLSRVSLYTGLRLLDDLATSMASLGTKKISLVETARAEGERLEAAALAVPLASEAFRSTFEQAIDQLTRDDQGNPQWSKLVVLIDDLDRCADPAVVRLLESLKLYLNAPNCVFVIAADRRAVVRALQRELFSGKDGALSTAEARLYAEEYSEKLFQSVQPLPVAWTHDALLLRGWHDLQVGPLSDPTSGTPEQIAARVAPAAARASAEGPRLVALNRDPQTCFLPPNPRKVKRWLTELDERLRRLDDPQARQDHLELLCALQALQTFHPDLYRVLEAQPAFWCKLADFARLGDLVRDTHPAFAGLRVPGVEVEADQQQALQARRTDTFHDPAEVGLLRCAGLVRQLEARGVPHDLLYRLLQGQPAPSVPAAPTTAGPEARPAATLSQEPR